MLYGVTQSENIESLLQASKYRAAIRRQFARIDFDSNQYAWNLRTNKCKSLFSRYL